MTSDEKRREVAAKLRAEAVLDDFGFGDMDMPTYEAFDQMADLIDLPTCHICATYHEFEDSVRCDRCRTTFMRPCDPFKYCPECGAKVTDGGGCDVREL